MANFKRGKTRRNVRCTLCTPLRWLGNSRQRQKAKDLSSKVAAMSAMKEID